MKLQFGDTAITVNVPTAAALLAEVRARFLARQGFALATLNLDHMVKLRRDPAYRPAYAAQDLIVADGKSILALSWLAGRRLGLAAGSDMVLPLARVAAETGTPVALFGSSPDSLEKAGRVMCEQVPGLEIVAQISPPLGFDPQSPLAAELLAEVAQSGARMCFLALGAPKQECLAARARSLHPEIGFASIGAGLDFLSGAQRRAPVWVRKLALEWFWRMMSNPRRLAGRYASCALILPSEALRALGQRQTRRQEFMENR